MSKFYPKTNQNYWMLNSRFEVRQTTHTGSAKSKARISAGNAFRTQEAAEEFKEFITSQDIYIAKSLFDRRIALAEGFITGAGIAVIICSWVMR